MDQRRQAALIAQELEALTAAAPSWKWQLRDKDGKWLEMGSRVSWLASGKRHFGKVTGSAQPGFATVVSESSGDRRLIATSHLTRYGTPPVGHSDPDIVAERLIRAAKGAEPSTTHLLETTVARHGGYMEGLSFRRKEKKSLVRKILMKSKDKGISLEEAANGISDALRYTAVMDPDKNIDGAREILKRLQAEGHEVLKIENYWPLGDDYSGINIDMKAPNGQKWELQIHTPDSFQTKEYGTHKDYEITRDDANSLKERQAAYDRMIQLWDSVEQPPGWESFGEVILRNRRPVAAGGWYNGDVGEGKDETG